MTNAFFALILILVITDPRDPFTYQLEDVVGISKCVRVPGWPPKFSTNLFIYFFIGFI